MRNESAISVQAVLALLSVNGDKQSKAVSLIKLPILAEPFREVECGLHSLEGEVWVTQADLTGGGGTLRLETGFPNGVPQQVASRKVGALC